MDQLFYINQGDNINLSESILLLNIGNQHCCLALANMEADQLFQLGYYSFPQVSPGILNEIFSKHQLLSGNFKKIKISFDFPFQTFIPLEYYKKDDEIHFLDGRDEIKKYSSVFSDKIQGFQFYNVYAVPSDIDQYLTTLFKEYDRHNHYSLTIAKADIHANQQTIFVDFRKDQFAIVVFSSNKLLLARLFVYQTPEDVLYYLLNVTQQFGLSQDNLHLMISGLVDKDSALYKYLYQYFIHVDFRNAQWRTPDFPLHYFTTLNDLALCG